MDNGLELVKPEADTVRALFGLNVALVAGWLTAALLGCHSIGAATADSARTIDFGSPSFVLYSYEEQAGYSLVMPDGVVRIAADRSGEYMCSVRMEAELWRYGPAPCHLSEGSEMVCVDRITLVAIDARGSGVGKVRLSGCRKPERIPAMCGGIIRHEVVEPIDGGSRSDWRVPFEVHK